MMTFEEWKKSKKDSGTSASSGKSTSGSSNKKILSFEEWKAQKENGFVGNADAQDIPVYALADKKIGSPDSLNTLYEKPEPVNMPGLQQIYDAAQITYDEYVKSDKYQEYLRNKLAAQGAGLLRDSGVSTSPYAAALQQPTVEAEDAKEAELRSIRNYYKTLLDAEQDQAVMDADLAKLESWPEEDRKALETYVNFRNNSISSGGYAVPAQEAYKLLVAKYGKVAVANLSESLQRSQNRINAEALRENTTAKVQGKLGASFLHSAATVPANLLGAVSSPIGVLGDFASRTGRYKTLDPYNNGNMANVYSGAVRGQVAQDIAGDEYNEFTGEQTKEGGALRQTAAYAYQGLMSAADSLARAAVGGGSAITLGLAATGSFGQTVSDASARGATPAQAAILGVITGGLEVATEHMGLDEMMKIVQGGKVTGKQLVKNIFKQAAVEITEEEISFLGSLIAEAAVLREKSEYKQQIAEAIANGASYEEALNMANRSAIKEAIETAIISGFSGGVSAVGSSAVANANYKTVTQGIEKEAEGRLKKLGETEDVPEIAKLVAKRVLGEELTAEEKTKLTHSQYGAQVAKEFDPDKSKRYTALDERVENAREKAKDEPKTEATGEKVEIIKENVDTGNVDAKMGADGKMVWTVDGKETKTGDMQFENTDTAYMFEAVEQIENITPTAAPVLIKNVDTSKDVVKQLNGMDEAYTYGYHGYTEAEMKTGDFISDLTNHQMMEAYRLGQAARKANVQSRDSRFVRMNTEKDTTAEKHTAATFESNEAQVYFEDGGKTVKFDEAKINLDENTEAGKRRRAAVNTAKFLSKMGIGGKYYFYESYKKNGKLYYKNASGKEVLAPNGLFKDSDGSIHIDLNAGNRGEGTSLYTIAHELGHFVKAYSEEQFQKLADLVREAYSKTDMTMHERVLAKQEALSKLRDQDVTYDEAFEEVVADALSTMFTDGNIYDKIVELKTTDRNLFDTIKRFFDKMIAKFKEAYAKLTPDQKDAQDIREMKDMFDRIQDAFANALVEASDNFHVAMESVVEAKSDAISADEIITDGAVVTDGKGEKHSIRSMKHDISEGKMFEDLKSVCGWSNAQVNELRTQLKDLVEYMIPYRDILDMNESYGREGRRFSPYKPNSDPLYKISMDFSTLCSKRLLTQYVIENLQLRENRPMSAEEQMAIRDMLNEYRKVEKGLQVACAMCYVEAARLKSPKQIQRWLDDPTPHLINYFALKNSEFNASVKNAQADFKESKGYDRNAPKKDMKPSDVKELNKIGPKLRSQYQLSAEEQAIVEKAKTLPNSTYLTAGNLASLSETDPVIYDAYTAFVRTATRSKSLETDEPYYYGDSRRDNGNGIIVSDSFIEAVNRENGMRFSSWSDWRIQHMLDYITAVIDNSVRGAAMHGYTKFGEEVRVLGKTGMMFNMSGVAGTQNGLNPDGSLSFSDTESIDVNEAIQLREEFPDTAGLQCIGVSNEHIIELLRSDIIDYVIPYHVSGLNAALRRMADIHGWKDYTSTQHAAIDKSIKFENAVDQDHWHEEPVYSEFFVGYDTGMTGIEAMRASAEKYKQLCKDRGLKPKFEQFAQEENYWKLLIDRKMVNQKTGKLIQQRAVTPTFDFSTIKEVVDRYVQNYDAGLEKRALNHIVENWDSIPKRIKDLKKGGTKAKQPQKAVNTLANQTVAAQPSDGIKRSDGIVDQMKRFMDSIMAMESVTSINKENGVPFLGSRNENYKAGGKVFKAQGGLAVREGYGTVQLTVNGAKESVYHGNGPAKQATFPAIKAVIEHGLEVGRDYNHNGKGFDTVTFAAPIDFFGHKEALGVVVKEFNSAVGEKNFYIHEICDQNGNYIQLDNGIVSVKEKAASARPNPKSAADAANEGSSPTSIVAHPEDGVKKNSDRYSERTPDSISNRSLLANAFEGLSQNSIEYSMIQEYKQAIKQLNDLDEQLSELNQEIRQIRFGKDVERDKAKLDKLEEKAARISKEINRYDKRLLNMEASEPLRKVIERERKKASQKTREHVKEIQQNRKVKKEQTEIKKKIRRVIRDLDKILNRGNKKKNVKEDMQDFVSKALKSAEILFTDNYGTYDMLRNGIGVEMTDSEEALVKSCAQMLSDIDKMPSDGYDSWQSRQEAENKLRAKMSKLNDVFARERKRLNNTTVSSVLGELADAYASFEKSEQSYVQGAYTEAVHNFLKNLQSEVGGTIVTDMTKSQLESVYAAYQMVMTTVRKANELFNKGIKMSREQVGNAVIKEVIKAGGTHGLWTKSELSMNQASWNNTKPIWVANRIGSEAFGKLMDGLFKGQYNFAVDVDDAKKFKLEMDKKYHPRKWDAKKLYSFESTTGKKFELNLQQIMSLYAFSKREQAHSHLLSGGFVFESNSSVIVDKKGVKRTYLHDGATSYKLNVETLGEIIGTLSSEQKAYVDEMQKYLSDVMGAKGNEVSMELYGIQMFKEKNYFPLRSSGAYMEKAKEAEMKKQQGQINIANSGFTHSVKPEAKNPIILSNFLDVWAEHCNEMSMYHSMVLPMEDFRKVYNYSTIHDENMDSASVYQTIQDAYGKAATDYIDQLYRELNAGATVDPRETAFKAGISKFKKASVMLSASVVVQQFSAIGRAYALIDPKYFVGAKVKSDTQMSVADEMKKYAPVAIIKEMGGFDTGTKGSAKSYIMAEEYGKSERVEGLIKDEQYRGDIMGYAPAKADEITWCAIWEAVKRETKAKHSGMDVKSENFLKLAGDRFSEIIERTQVYDSVLARSANMRSKSAFMSMATAFMAEPTTTINLLEDALRGRSVKKIARAFGAVATSILINNALAAVVYAMRDDDEDETFIEKYFESFASGMIDDINPLTYYPFLKDIYSLFQGYDVERADMSVIADLRDALKQAMSVIGKDTSNMDDDELAEHHRKINSTMMSILDAGCSALGVPFKNVRRDVNGIINAYKTIKTDLSGERKTTWNSFWDKVGAAVKDTIPIYAWTKDQSKSDRLYEVYVSGDKEYLNRLKNGYKDEEAFTSAVRKSLRENDSRIHEAAMALYKNNAAGYSKQFNAILKEGAFSAHDIREAIDSELSKIKSDNSNGTDTSAYNASDFVKSIIVGDTASAKQIRAEYISKRVSTTTTREEAEKAFKESVNGNVRDSFKAKLLSKDMAQKIMTQYGGKSKEEAEDKLTCWEFQMKYPDVDISDNAILDYYDIAQPLGIKLSSYLTFVNGKKDAKRDEVVTVIHKLPLTQKQKDALYLMAGYAESKIWDTPWHK